ncbi:MAG: DUF805 domain-containing protein [Bacteroidales bacterium]|nr:DUF805 domain-containing protein [Bacteroidales bacterium]
MEWYLKVWKQYADFSGRARRKEFWMFVLFNLLAGIVLGILSLIPVLGIILYVGYMLAIIVPVLALTVRRLHDVGRSGWWYFIGLIPLVGSIILLVWSCTNSQSGDNKWGANPKA